MVAAPPMFVAPPIFVAPLILTVPTTSKFAVGVIVPIPRFPQISNRATSTPFMRNGNIFCEGSRLLTSISFGCRIYRITTFYFVRPSVRNLRTYVRKYINIKIHIYIKCRSTRIIIVHIRVSRNRSKHVLQALLPRRRRPWLGRWRECRLRHRLEEPPTNTHPAQ